MILRTAIFPLGDGGCSSNKACCRWYDGNTFHRWKCDCRCEHLFIQFQKKLSLLLCWKCTVIWVAGASGRIHPLCDYQYAQRYGLDVEFVAYTTKILHRENAERYSNDGKYESQDSWRNDSACNRSYSNSCKDYLQHCRRWCRCISDKVTFSSVLQCSFNDSYVRHRFFIYK